MENMTRAPQEKFASLKGNSASTALNQSDQRRSRFVLFCNRAKLPNVFGSRSLTWANGIRADKIYCVFQGSC